MAVRINEELRRPLPLTLAIAAAAGWMIALFLLWSDTSPPGSERNLAAQPEQHRRASGTLAELQSTTAGVQADVTRTIQEREQAPAQLSAVRQDLETARQNAADASLQAEEQVQRLSQLQQDMSALNQRLAAGRSELASIEESVTAQSQELAEVGRRLEAARQQEAQAREVLAKLTEEAAAKTNEVAKAKQQLPQRQAEAAAQKQKPTLTNSPAPAGDLFRDDLTIGDLPRATSPAGRKVDDSAAGPTGSVKRVPSAQARRPAATLNPNSCASRSQASTGILDLTDRVIARIMSGGTAGNAHADMARLQDASQRLSRNDVAGACAIVTSVRKRYPVRPN
jgi:hypothetical protein